MNKIFFITFVTISFLLSVSVSAQENGQQRKHFDREAFQAKRNAFITAEVGLTPEEAALFIPLSDELKKKKFELGSSYRKYIKEMRSKKNPTDAEFTKAVDDYLNLCIKEAELEKEYAKKFKRILSPEKLYKYQGAELKFAREYMRGPKPERR
ncbi:MAG: hypothetical protein LLG05_01640 [Porphyromonadaceae bacterium]|jgi:hypothetical protein|nr:hypothetical protein [uncultured Macellibacteroides sp.]MCE5224545.1 hypothetical protein [Porphyromonadaceae bacterium]